MPDFTRRIKSFGLAYGSFLAFIPVALFIIGTGVFMLQYGSTGVTENINRERSRIARNLERRLGEVAVDALQLSQVLSLNIENLLRTAGAGIALEDLSDHPDMLELVTDNQLGIILLALDNAKVSGVFMLLEATINPRIDGAEYSRAGFYIRNMEPFVPGAANKLYLRGFADFALKNKLTLQSNWDLELSIRNKDYYHVPADTFRKNPSLPLSRSFYWTFEDAVDAIESDGLEEPALLCSVPLVSSQGKFLGVCGFEISEDYFELLYSPDDNLYPQLLCMFAPFDGTSLDSGRAFYSGVGRGMLPFAHAFRNIAQSREIFNPPDDFAFTDSREIIKLYPVSSPYLDNKMALTLGMIRQNYNRLLFYRSGTLAVILIVSGGGVLAFSLFLKRHYKKAYAEQLAKLEAQFARTPPDFDRYGLSAREKEICLLLLKGFTIKQIGGELFIAFATANTHCQNIYRKLDINSRQELFLKFGA
jgi:DNA-binding CsgD family transcriptional regulator